jgi:alpha,alpha-trehalose phosphorylase
LNSFYELRSLPYAEGGYAYPEYGQTLINGTNGKIIRLLVDDEPFDVRYGICSSHERELDLRNGVLRRSVRWTSPGGHAIQVTSERIVSLTQRAIAAICYEVEPFDSSVRIVVQSEQVANEELPEKPHDPRVGAMLESPLESEEHLAQGTLGLLVHHTEVSRLRLAAAMDHQIEGPPEMVIESISSPDVARVTIATQLKPGERLRIIKFIAYGWSSMRSRPALHSRVMAALTTARLSGWDGLLAEQRTYLDDFWAGADVELEGDQEIQQAVRFALFHVLQAGARAECQPIPAKGLTGPGYEGHAFWDMEIFVLPVLTLTVPRAAADALRWLQLLLPQAKERARLLGLRGAAFPWRTIRGA